MAFQSGKFQLFKNMHAKVTKKRLWEILLFIQNPTVNSKQRHINFISLIAAITGLFRGLTTRVCGNFPQISSPVATSSISGVNFYFSINKKVEVVKNRSIYLQILLFPANFAYREKAPLKIHADIFNPELDAEFFQFLQFRDDGRKIHVARAVFVIVVLFVDFFDVRNWGQNLLDVESLHFRFGQVNDSTQIIAITSIRDEMLDRLFQGLFQKHSLVGAAISSDIVNRLQEVQRAENSIIQISINISSKSRTSAQISSARRFQYVLSSIKTAFSSGTSRASFSTSTDRSFSPGSSEK